MSTLPPSELEIFYLFCETCAADGYEIPATHECTTCCAQLCKIHAGQHQFFQSGIPHNVQEILKTDAQAD
jgi:hypothetical protein